MAKRSKVKTVEVSETEQTKETSFEIINDQSLESIRKIIAEKAKTDINSIEGIINSDPIPYQSIGLMTAKEFFISQHIHPIPYDFLNKKYGEQKMNESHWFFYLRKDRLIV